MSKVRKMLILLLALWPFIAFGQLGGESTYQFLNLPQSARTAALGGKIATSDDKDLSLVISNPSLLDSTMDNHVDLSYINYISDVNYVSALFSHSYKIGVLAIGIQQLGYGDFKRTNSAGVIEGIFNCNETCLSAMYAYQIDSSFKVGMSLKLVNSVLDTYHSMGISLDFGAYYTFDNGFAAGVVCRNLGFMLKSYNEGNQEHLPFEMVAGISKKLEHAPLRIVLTMHQLQNMNMRYKPEEETTNLFDDGSASSETIIQKIGREAISHVILGFEFIPTKVLSLRVGYNYQRRNELKIQEKASAVGFSFGVGLKISKFNIDYCCASYHLAGLSNHFSISTDLNQLFQKF